MKTAPLHPGLGPAPICGSAHWITAADGLRLRVAHWRAGPGGTVLIFPGRTEYVEKYSIAATAFAAAGLSSMAIDWRGQGLSDRMLDNPLGGHVEAFTDYQMDVAAMMAVAAELEMPRPWHLMAHSMGGAIGLRALHEGLDVVSAGFSAPMWGLALSGRLRAVAWSLSWAAGRLGLGHHFVPGTTRRFDLEETPFEENLLTSDPEMFDALGAQLLAHPELGLAGPSLHWLNEALRESRALRRMPAPPYPTITFLGSEEKIVDPAPIHDRMADWPGGQLEMIAGGRHETMIETPERRGQFFAGLRAHYARHAMPPELQKTAD